MFHGIPGGSDRKIEMVLLWALVLCTCAETKACQAFTGGDTTVYAENTPNWYITPSDDLDGTETQYWRFVFLCFADMREKPSTDRAFMILWT